MSDFNKAKDNRKEELDDEELTEVSGGLNPQPLPPRSAHAFPIFRAW
jgi:bacteriocin-like protein